MEERYLRNIGALSEAECERLRKSRVFVAGCGGLGGYLTDMLLRLGVGYIRTADGDVFEASNLNRQLLSNANTLGCSKADTAARYAAAVNPDVDFCAKNELITEENVTELIEGCDAVIDALDSIPSRKILKAGCDRLGIPYIYGAVSGWTALAALSVPGDGLIDRLYPDEAQEGGRSVLAFTPALCASIQCSLCVSLLCGRETQPGKLYYFDLEELEYESVSE